MVRLESDVARRLLRALVPAVLAGGFMALYPAIAERVVERYGRGFEPPFVALYVTALVVLFLADAWVRDRRLARLRAEAQRERDRAEAAHQRAEALRLLLDVAAALETDERLEAALANALGRASSSLSFQRAAVYLAEQRSGRLSRRGVWPLTASFDAAEHEAANATFRTLRDGDATRGAQADDTRPGPAVLAIASTSEGNSEPARVCVLLRARGEPLGLLVCEGIEAAAEDTAARLGAIADRLAMAVLGKRLFAELEAKERALRHAYRELRTSGRNLARSRAAEEAGIVGHAAAAALSEPLRRALDDARALRAEFAGYGGFESGRGLLEHLVARLKEMRSSLGELRRVGDGADDARPLDVNDVLVSALDLALPGLRRAGIEARLALSDRIDPVVSDEAMLQRVIQRALSASRASLRRAPAPRRLMVETRRFGDGVRISITDNGPGLRPRSGQPASRASSSLKEALSQSSKSFQRNRLRSAGISVRQSETVGVGRTTTIVVNPRPTVGEPATPPKAEGFEASPADEFRTGRL
jgi:hypothetical protein